MSCGPPQPGRYAVICNFAVATKTAKLGARAFIAWCSQGSPDNVRLRFQSRGGRWITKYEATKRLTNLRIKTVPESAPMFGDRDVCLFETRAQAEAHAAYYRTSAASCASASASEPLQSHPR